MGDPKSQRKKYAGPGHPWNAERIEVERELMKSYGMKNKRELWKHASMLKKFADQAKGLIAKPTHQGQKEAQQLLQRLEKLGLMTRAKGLEGVLSLTLKDLLDRRLQSLVFKAKMARSIDQARQFIVHEHVSVAGQKMTRPSYLVPKGEEAQISFSSDSSFTANDHPERIELPQKAKKAPKRDFRDQRPGRRGDMRSRGGPRR